MNPTTNIMCWNSISIINKLLELPHYAQKYNIDIIALSETLLKNKHKLNSNGYNIYRNDCGRGVALLIRSNTKHFLIKLPVLKSLIAVASFVEIGNTEVLVIAAYISPSTKLDCSELCNLFGFHIHVILLGDLNCKHVAWNCFYNNRNGKSLLEYSLNHNIRIIAPDMPTYIPDRSNARPSVLDIALTKNMDFNIVANSHSALSFDHNPVLLNISGKINRLQSR